MVKPELGIKRLCTECGAKFYDLLKNPIVCPKCGATYAVVAPTPKGKPPAPAAAAPVHAVQVEEIEIAKPVPEEAAELVPLEEAEAEQAATGAKDAKLPEDEVEIEGGAEDAADDDSTFLVEEEEEDTNVTDLIGSEIKEEEEP